MLKALGIFICGSTNGPRRTSNRPNFERGPSVTAPVALEWSSVLQARRMKLLAVTAAMFTFTLASNGSPAHACACCSNLAQRSVQTQKVDAFAAGVLADIHFAEAAHLYTGEADLETIGGMAAKSTDFRLSVTKTDASWVLDFEDRGGGGKLIFKLPPNITRFEIDPREGANDANGTGPALYKEWRLTTRAVGTDMFKGATGGDQRATLILHGRGNSCTDASQFGAWTLLLHGSKATNKLFGSLSPR
jgi:hypothetical protein